MARRRKSRAVVDEAEDVPGPSPNPLTNILLADIIMRAGSYVLRDVVERKFLKGRYGRDTARDIVSNRSFKHTAASFAVAKVATRSVPGAVIVGTGLAAKLLFDRSQKRRKAKRAGDRKLLEQAADE